MSGVGAELENSLAQERSLVTQFSAQRISADVTAGTVTFEVSVTLKEGAEDTVVRFATGRGQALEIVPGEHQGGLHYSACVTCPIMDEPPIDLLVERGGITQSQTFYGECYESDYAIRLSGETRWAALEQSGLGKDAVEPAEIYAFLDPGPGLEEPLELVALEGGIFLNDDLVTTLPLELSEGNRGALGEWNFHCQIDIPLPEGMAASEGTLTFAVLARDNYGREASAIISRYRVQEDGSLSALANERLALDDGTYGTEEWG